LPGCIRLLNDALLRKIEFRRESRDWGTGYPFDLPVVQSATEIALHPQVTFLVGENGSGKSTLLEAIAIAWGLNAEGGSKNFRFHTKATHSDLFKCVRLIKGVRSARDAYFLRAETLYNVVTEAERLGAREASLHECSHGEAFLHLFLHRFGGNSFFVLDEPEAALSPIRQLAVLARMHDLVAEGSQFFIATHSPILMGYPGAWIYQLNEQGLDRVEYEQTDHFLVTRRFLASYPRMLRDVLTDARDDGERE
jgi:predicted ATPase